MERRSLLKKVGSSGALSATGGGAVVALSQEGAAATIGQFSISGDSVTTDDGTISSFSISSEVSVEYDGLDTEAAGIAIGLGVFGPSGSEDILTSQQYNVSDVQSLNSYAGSYTTQFENVDVLAKSSYSASNFEDTTEGDGPKETMARFVCLFEIFDADGNSITPGGQPEAIFKEGTVTVSVTNEDSSSGVGGDGDVSVTGEDQDP